MYVMRRLSVRHARFFEAVWIALERVLTALDPLWRVIGYERLAPLAAVIEKYVKGALFDCRMCGQCALSSTGMSCPMNCPKALRNGPCGGVRANGCCEVEPQMRCVWVEAVEGARRMRGGLAIQEVQFAPDVRLMGKSSWLHVARANAEAARKVRGEVGA